MSAFGLSAYVASFLFAVLIIATCNGDDLPTCQPKDFHYEFTECDENQGRWRVSVPKPNTCVGGAPNAPVRLQDCTTSCDSGTFFNRTILMCDPCPPGTYSLGGGEKFDSWNTLPLGFHASFESFERAPHFPLGRSIDGHVNCSERGWTPKNMYIASYGGPCVATLTYSVKLVKPGELSFTYQHSDDSILMNFGVQNDQCHSVQEAEKYQWPPKTDEGKWNVMTVKLKTGHNVLYWKTVGLGLTDQKENLERKVKPVLIKSIEITGVAYTSECSPCKPGTFSQKGMKSCDLCPENTYSGRGASVCTSCDTEKFYAPKGSSECLERKPCSKYDYYMTYTPCNEAKQTTMIYKWAEPKICRSDISGSVKLPPPSEKKSCPPCNPGMERSNHSTCSFCMPDHYSDGSGACLRCPVSTLPNYGLQYRWWHEMPPGMSSYCLSLVEGGCDRSNAWQPAGNHIQSAGGYSAEVYLVLSLNVPGFRSTQRVNNGRPSEVGKISFEFEVDCAGDCEFLFMMTTGRKLSSIVERWLGMQPKQHYSFSISTNDSYTFNWAFQKFSMEESSGQQQQQQKNVSNGNAKIYEIKVTNTIVGGASECISCPRGTENAGCIPCPSGHYLQDKASIQCTACPPNTYISEPFPVGVESCKPCGPGLMSRDGQNCYSDCHIYFPNAEHFDLSPLSRPMEISGSPLFTASGTQYFHVFNISLCGHGSRSGVVCRNNFSYPDDGVQGMICRSTVVPLQGGHTSSSQAVSLGDNLIGVTTKSTFENISIPEEFVKSAEGSHSDLNFYYTSAASTPVCRYGRSTTITLRCDKNQEGIGEIQLPSSCPDGTCDGCSFHFLWRSALACRLCTEEDYEVVKGECIHGTQTIHYISPKGCIPPNGSIKSMLRTQYCVVLSWGLQIAIGSSAACALLLLVLVCYFWKKNRKLEYNYMKLVQSSSGKECELPAAESCAIDDDEEDHYDNVAFNAGGKGILAKFRTIRLDNSKAMEDSQFETIHLTKKDALT